MHNVNEIWERALAFTRSKSTSFEQWFAGVQFDGLSDGVLSLRARDEWVREWVDRHFIPTLADFLRGETGWTIHVAWTIDVGLDNPVVREPSPPSVRPFALSTRPSSPPPPPLPEPVSDVPARAEARSLPVTPSGLGRALAAVPAPIAGLNPKYTFSNFVIGPSNQ